MIRPTFLGFETAKKGITTAQKGLDVTGHNLTNWDSVGYTRQRITQVAVAPDSYRNRYSSSKVGPAGQGVDISGVAQIRDAYLDKRYRDETAEVGYYDQAVTILTDIQSAMNEYNPTTDTGLRASIMAMSDALQSFSINSYSETHANIVLSAFKNLTQTIQQISAKLDSAREQQIYDLDVSVQEVNLKLQKIAELNRAILDDANNIQYNPYFGPNELYDERNQLLDELSRYADIHYTSNVDGTINVEVNGQMAVTGTKYDKMEMTRDPYTDVVGLRWISTNKPVELTNGSLKASTDYINGRGPNLRNTGESTERGFLYYKDQLNDFAQTLANVANSIIPATDANGSILYEHELDADGQPIVDKSYPDGYKTLLLLDENGEPIPHLGADGKPVYRLDARTGEKIPRKDADDNPIYAKDEDGDVLKDADGNNIPEYEIEYKYKYQTKQLLGGLSSLPGDDGKYYVQSDIPITADNISVTDEWSNNSGYVIFQRNPDEHDTADNVGNYALSLADAIANGTHRFEPNGATFDGTFLDYVKNYVTTLAEDVSFSEGRQTATTTIQQNLEDSRDSVSGVVVDEEVANMMLYNKSLSAASRLLTAMDEALDTIINKTGLVGR